MASHWFIQSAATPGNFRPSWMSMRIMSAVAASAAAISRKAVMARTSKFHH